jgi:hypothetical protein
MPLSRDPRSGRRRRLMRDSFTVETEFSQNAVNRTRARRPGSEEIDEKVLAPKRSPGYSQNVRRECQHRLVQLIPVRRRSFLLAVMVSCLIPILLLAGHYALFVYPSKWQNHPMAVLLYASHPRSLCAWLSSQLWLMCLGSTILTFRLRRHKLDDYDGEYRLWFWLVATCVLGSIDSTSRVSELFGNALDRWSQLNLGWSGTSVVQATSATLIGMLGIRLCTELKMVPASLVFWLVGLVSWAASAALSHSMLKTDMNPAMREWLRSALWIGGLTSIWLSSLAYLRFVYIEAQRRFLLRGKLAASIASTWRERLVESMPRMPSLRLKPPNEESVDESKSTTTSKKKTLADSDVAQEPKKSRFGWPSFGKKALPATADASAQRAQVTQPVSTYTNDQAAENSKPVAAGPLHARKPVGATTSETRPVAVPANQAGRTTSESRDSKIDKSPSIAQEATDKKPAKSSWMGRLLGKSNRSDEAPEFRKVDKAANDGERARIQSMPLESKKTNAQPENEDQSKKRSWIRLPKMPKISMPALPKIGLPKMPKLKMPKLKLPSLRLPPPEPMAPTANNPSSAAAKENEHPVFKPIPSNKPFPTTNGPAQESIDANGGRPLSKAERKKLKRGIDDQEGQRRAA